MRGAVLPGIMQVAGLALAPMLPGLVQQAKARLQGRVGAPVHQPYRELRRLWSRSVVAPEGTTLIYRLAPSVCAAAVGCAVLVVPVGTHGIGWLGTDALVLAGLLALARFATAASAWDPGSGFALMAAGRDLMFGVFAEPLLLFSLALFALGAGSTDLRTMAAGAGDAAIAGSPAHWCGVVALLLVVLVETGRQPVDNPDTHLELTMVHEGPLLEYAGRDLAMLHWASAARHWVVLVLVADLVMPTGGSATWGVAAIAACVVALCMALAVVETLVAKARILRVPALLGVGFAVCVIGLASAVFGGVQ